MKQNTSYLGLDVHKESISVAIAEGGREGEVRLLGEISNDMHALEKLLAKLRKAHPGESFEVCYEAGPCGFGIARRLEQLGVTCSVIAPSLIPQRSGDRVKTDTRDAIRLARLLRAGELTSVYVPDAADEAIRDLCRARSDAVDDQRRSRFRLKAFLLRNGYRYQGKSSWGTAHMRYLRELVLPHAAQKAILEEYLIAIENARERIQRTEQSMELMMESWHLKDAVEALMAMRGFRLVAAMITVSELGDIHRFQHPRQLMAYLGLTGSESSSGGKQRQGSISRTGNGHLRWLMVECAQHYALAPKISKELSLRQDGIPREILSISWKAQNRLHLRLLRLLARRVPRNKALVAVARELCGFIWAVLRCCPCYINSESRMVTAA
jgi:transposase